MLEKPIKNLGRWSDSKLRDYKRTLAITQEIVDELQSIDQSFFAQQAENLVPGLLPCTEKMINSYARKYLGIPQCLMNNMIL